VSGNSHDSYRGHYDGYSSFGISYDPPAPSRSYHDEAERKEEERKERERLAEAERKRVAAEAEHARKVEEARERIKSNPPPPPAASRSAAKTARFYDRSLVRLGITTPASDAEGLYYVLVDNSASNDLIRSHIRATVEYVLGTACALLPKHQIVFDFVSDHEDGDSLFMQEIDYVFPDEQGVKTLGSSVQHVYNADGGDIPECFACPLERISKLNFGKVPKERRHIILVTDSIPHGFGWEGDNGCDARLEWGSTLRKVQETFATFQVIGCPMPGDRIMLKLQKKMLPEGKARYDFLDISTVRDHERRKALVSTAILFLMARNKGRQTVEGFLAALYLKWLKEPIFGGQTDSNAREQITTFATYIEASQEEIDALLERIFVKA